MTTALQEKISKVAYELYERNGRQKGNELLNWLAAEKIVHFQQMIFPEIDGEAIALLEYKPFNNARRFSPPLKKQTSRSGRSIKKQAQQLNRA